MKINSHLLPILMSLLLCPISLLGQEKINEGIGVSIAPNASEEQILEAAIKVRPSSRQLDYQEREMLGFIHIGMNTFTGREWGTGKESPSIFNPKLLNAEDWVRTFKEAGLTGVILVAKHHDGFCVWPSRYTNHTIAYSPWRDGKGDLVKEVSDACRKYGMKFSIYLSPWDMHEPTYGTAAYNDHYIHQLEELLTNYGPVYLLWFDGAGTSSDVSGHEMPFDWPRIFKRARELQPNVILSGNAPDVRWVGNEAGRGRDTEWCVQGVPTEEPLFGTLKGYASRDANLGSISQLKGSKRLVWYPSRGGLPLRKGWFYTLRDDNSVKSLRYLVNSYFSTVGCNSNLLPNLSPDTTGRFPTYDAQQLIRFGKIIQGMKAVDYAQGATATPHGDWQKPINLSALTDSSAFTSWQTLDGVTQAEVVLKLKHPSLVDVIKVQENVRDYGQRVEQFAVDVDSAGTWHEVGRGTTIGYRRMLRLPHPVKMDSIRIRVLNARKAFSISNIALYRLPEFQDNVTKEQVHKSIPYKFELNNLQTKSSRTAFSDNDPSTAMQLKVKAFPAAIILTFDHPTTLTSFAYLPSTLSPAHVDRYAIYLSRDGKTWEKAASEGRFGNIENNPVEQQIPLKAVGVKALKFELVRLTQDKKEVGISEIKVFGK